jgi:hypothetical protein
LIGVILIIAFMAIVFPITISLSGAVAAALHGEIATRDAEARHEGSELVEFSRH